MTARYNATLVVDADGLVSAIRCYTQYPSPVGLTPDAWFAAERAAGREWRVDRDTPFLDGYGPLGHTLEISRNP